MPTTASEANAATATQPRPNAATATQPRPPRVSDENAHPNLWSSQDNAPDSFSYDDSSDDESKDRANKHVNKGLEDPRDTRPVNVEAEMELIVDKLARTEDVSMSPSNVYTYCGGQGDCHKVWEELPRPYPGLCRQPSPSCEGEAESR